MLLSGKPVAEEIELNLKKRIESLSPDVPQLAILIGTTGGGEVAYSRAIVKKAEGIGMRASIYTEDNTDNFTEKLKKLAIDKNTGAIILQRPYPEGIDESELHTLIPPEKDIDGASYDMMGRLLSDTDAFHPATAKAIVSILDYYDCPLEGSHACIVGRSISVGKPVSLLLLQRNATVTICHSRTQNLAGISKSADILIVAVGKKHYITKDFVSDNTWLVDVGYNYDKDGGPYGDCAFEEIKDEVFAITPVPGGVGSVTTMTLLQNALVAISRNFR